MAAPSGGTGVGLLGSLLRGLAVRRPGTAGTGAPVHEAALRAEEALRGVELPGYDIDIVSAGLVERIRVSHSGEAVMVFLGYKKSDPGCSFCRFISAAAWAKIVEASLEALRRAGFRRVILVDADTGALLAEEEP